MDLGLRDKVALITGGSSGLGLASAIQLAREGCRVLLFSRSRPRLEEARRRVLSESGQASVDIFEGDLTREEDVDRLFNYVESEYGGLHVLVYSTGGPRPGRFFDLDLGDWDYAYKLLARSAIQVAGRAARIMIKGGWGRIILVGSITLLRPQRPLSLSNIMRMPITGIVRDLALELAPYNITVNAVLPSLVLTPRVEQLAEDRARREGITKEEALKAMGRSIPMGRLGRPEEVGYLVAFLASERASFITGALIPVDGGASIA